MFNLHLKKEPKKIRNVCNCDLVSFVKQTFLYEWMGQALPDNVKSKIFTLIHPRDKVLTIERILRNYKGEKWAVPMDLKDFHVQFGPKNHQSLIRCLERRLLSIRDSNIRREIQYILTCLKDELCRGILQFLTKTSGKESLEDAYEQLDEKHKQIINAHFIKKVLQKEPREEESQEITELENSTLDETQTTTTSSQEQTKKNKTESVNNNFTFDVQNGLLSGWKLTSLMGSIYNNSTNTFCNFWHLNRYGIIPTNYITQGDDTHFKCRFMSQAMFHIGLVNSIGKIAHPKKQFFSTHMTEFLKKLYNLNEMKMDYSPCRMISSILFEKENRKSKANNKNNMKDMIDIWNLFLIRIPDVNRREYIVKKGYAQNCIRIKFKFHNSRSKQFMKLEDMNKLFSTPSNINGYLLGPLTRDDLLFSASESYPHLGFNLMSSYFDAKMYDYILKYDLFCKEKS